jgi:serine/threonine protein kinase/Tol biopolymer transport system component
MTPERWQRVEDLFQAARNRTSADGRAAFLDGVCAGDAELRAEVEGLLDAEDSAGSFINTSAMRVAAGMIADERAAEMLGQSVAHYKILSPLGAGGMGEIYLAEDAELGRKVALKFLPDYAIVDDERVRRFRQEARVASALSHPNIAHIYEIGEWNGAAFIALEYVAGQTLATRIANGPIQVQEIVDIAVQIADALDEAHGQGITHRDIKSANIMLTSRGQVKVLDFGLAKMTRAAVITSPDHGSEVETRSGLVMGTVNYMSPEQALGRDVDGRSDIFSVGVVLYEMITGRLPFTGKSATETIDRLAHAQPEAIARFNNDVPPALDLIVKKALRKDRDERYQTAHDLLVDLKSLKRELQLEARVGYAIQPMSAGESPSPPSISEASVAPDTATIGAARRTTGAEYIVGEVKRQRRAVAIVLGVLALAAFIFLTSKFFRVSKSALPLQIGKVTRLTTTGKIANAATLSPDGKLFAYALREGEQESLWLGHVDGGEPVRIQSPTKAVYLSLTFAPDGSSLYFTSGENFSNGALYKLPVFGGIPEKVKENVRNHIAFAPDGKQFAFVRASLVSGKTTLVIADTQGAGEREIFTPGDKRVLAWHSPSWSTDGRTIALGASTNDNASSYEVFTVNLADGAIKPLTTYGWGRVEALTWLHDGSGLVVVASNKNAFLRQLWRVSYPGGETQRIVTDLATYDYSLTLSADDHSALSIQTQNQSNIWVTPAGDLSQARQITFGSLGRQNGYYGLDWTPDGRIVYTARGEEGWTIWITNADGSVQRQLIPNSGENYSPSVTNDARYLVFQSNRNGKHAVWRVGLDGSEMRQLTNADLAAQPDVSPDSKWVVYVSSHEVSTREDLGTLYRISIDGGDPVRLTVNRANWPRISPDSKLIACGYEDDGNTKLAILPIEGGEPLRLFNVPRLANFRLGIRWTPDGKALTYRDWINGIWKQNLAGGEAQRLTGLPEEKIFGYGWSRNGRHFAFTRNIESRDVILLGLSNK